MNIEVGVSARHIHINVEDKESLFGKNYVFIKEKDLTQEGMYSCKEKLLIRGPKGTIKNVRILGPEREYTQVEISKTDAYKLGVIPPVRDSGDLKDAAVLEIVGPCGEIKKQCAIISKRHIHIPRKIEKELKLSEKKVSLKVNTEKGGILDNISVRVENAGKFEVHLDIDDANAFLLKNNDEIEILEGE